MIQGFSDGLGSARSIVGLNDLKDSSPSKRFDGSMKGMKKSRTQREAHMMQHPSKTRDDAQPAHRPHCGLGPEIYLAVSKAQRRAQQHTYICLYHLAALSPDPAHEAVHIHLPLGVHHVQHGIDDNESARASHPGAERAEGTSKGSVKDCWC